MQASLIHRDCKQAELQSEPSTRPSADGDDLHSLLSAAVEDALFRRSGDGDGASSTRGAGL